MKTIIDGKRYDTDNAEVIGHWSNGLSTSDFYCCGESLYVTKTGQHFLHAEGGGLSKYADVRGNKRSWGQSIIPLTREEAFAWASSHLDADVFEDYFFDLIEDA